MTPEESKPRYKLPSHMLIEYMKGNGYTAKQAYDFFDKHPEFIGCEKDPERLSELAEVLDNKSPDEEEFYNDRTIVSLSSDLNPINVDSSNQEIFDGKIANETDIDKSEFQDQDELDDSQERGSFAEDKPMRELYEATKIVNKWLCKALDKNDGEMVRNACIVLKAIERKAYTDSLDISVTEDNGVYKVEAKSSYNNYEDSKVCYISKKSDGNLYVKFHEFSGLNGHLEGDSDYWGLNFALGAPSWMITSQEHEWDNVISKTVNKLHSENLTTNA